jgi:DNA-binding GntR family transcriptional regulator
MTDRANSSEAQRPDAAANAPARGRGVAKKVAAPDRSIDATQSSTERLYREIVRALYEGRLVPGQRLVEPDLMKQFHVGRGVVREVFRRLLAAGMVTLIRHRGASVHLMSREEVSQLLDVSATLFALACRRAAQAVRRDPASAARVAKSFEVMRPFEGQDNFVGFAEARRELHRAIMQLSANEELVRIFPAMKLHLMRLQFRSFEGSDPLLIADYGAIADAICSGDPDRADAVAQAYIRHIVDRVEGIPDRAFHLDD